MQKEKLKLKETDLYLPVRDFLIADGYEVKSEVHGCDVVALKGDEVVIVEQKLHFSIELLIQAVRRKKITDSVYVAVPALTGKKRMIYEKVRGMKELADKLEIGLLLVSPWKIEGEQIEVVSHPKLYVRKTRKNVKYSIINEHSQRSGDYNKGGSTQKKIFTSYKEKLVYIACCMEMLGVLSLKQMRALGADEKLSSIIQKDFYGWFARMERGKYFINEKCRQELEEYSVIAEKCRQIIEEKKAILEIKDELSK